jgi:hypothetical protein
MKSSRAPVHWARMALRMCGAGPRHCTGQLGAQNAVAVELRGFTFQLGPCVSDRFFYFF